MFTWSERNCDLFFSAMYVMYKINKNLELISGKPSEIIKEKYFLDTDNDNGIIIDYRSKFYKNFMYMKKLYLHTSYFKSVHYPFICNVWTMISNSCWIKGVTFTNTVTSNLYSYQLSFFLLSKRVNIFIPLNFLILAWILIPVICCVLRK